MDCKEKDSCAVRGLAGRLHSHVVFYLNHKNSTPTKHSGHVNQQRNLIKQNSNQKNERKPHKFSFFSLVEKRCYKFRNEHKFISMREKTMNE